MEYGKDAGAKNITLANNKVFSITFDAIGSAVSSCGYYNKNLSKWTANGTFDDAKELCKYSHLSTFAIFNENSKATDSEDNAIIVKQLYFIDFILVISIKSVLTACFMGVIKLRLKKSPLFLII